MTSSFFMASVPKSFPAESPYVSGRRFPTPFCRPGLFNCFPPTPPLLIVATNPVTYFVRNKWPFYVGPPPTRARLSPL